MENIFKVNDNVIRLGSLKDYTTHRLGVIININYHTKRARVHWILDRYNNTINVRTWVRISDLALKIY